MSARSSALAPRSAWLLGALLFGACEGGGPPPPPAASRVQAVVAKAPDQAALSGFCDVQATADGEPIAWPPLAGGSAPTPGAPHWVNLWATWCKPCIEELPMIDRWQRDWQANGDPARVLFVAVDGGEAELDAYRTAHPGTPESARLADPAALSRFMQALGLGEASGLPVHVFADKNGRARCVRAGAVVEDHRPLVEHLLRE